MPGMRPPSDRSSGAMTCAPHLSYHSFFDLTLFFGFGLDLKEDNAGSGESKLRARRTQIV
jgi:hypothetical protein